MNEFFSLYTAGILAFFLISIALLINRYFSKMGASDEEILIDVLMSKRAIKRDELREMTGFSDEKLERMLESIEEIVVEGDEIKYAGMRRDEHRKGS